MEEQSDEERLISDLRGAISRYITIYVNAPALETISENIEGQARLANLKALVEVVTNEVLQKGLSYDSEFLSGLSRTEVEKRINDFSKFISTTSPTIEQINTVANRLCEDGSKKFLLFYFSREFNWILISILSASYVSSLVHMRAIFELIVGIASRETGGMSRRINNIRYIGTSEKMQLNSLWNRLCAWAHPYGKWIGSVCPAYAAHAPIYHAELFNICLNEAERLIDFFVTVSIFKYEIDGAAFLAQLDKKHIEIASFNLLKHCLKSA